MSLTQRRPHLEYGDAYQCQTFTCADYGGMIRHETAHSINVGRAVHWQRVTAWPRKFTTSRIKTRSDGLAKKRADKVGPLLATAHPGAGELRTNAIGGLTSSPSKRRGANCPFGQPRLRKFESDLALFAPFGVPRHIIWRGSQDGRLSRNIHHPHHVAKKNRGCR